MSEWQALQCCLRSQRPTHLNQRHLLVRTATENMVIDSRIGCRTEVWRLKSSPYIMDPRHVRQVVQKKYMDSEIQLSDKAIYMDLGYSQ